MATDVQLILRYIWHVAHEEISSCTYRSWKVMECKIQIFQWKVIESS